MTGIVVRELQATDEQRMLELREEVADGGQVRFSTRYHVPYLQAVRSLHPDSACVIAQTPEGRVVGAAWIRFGRWVMSGADADYGLLHSLAVHPDFRRRGIARAMTYWRLDLVDRRGAELGREVTAVATIQRGNTASLANARRWATWIGGELTVRPVPMRRVRPRAHAGWQVRPATEDDLDVIADRLARRYQDFAMAPAAGRAWLSGWLVQHVATMVGLNAYLVVTDRSGRLLAGLGIVDEPRLSDLRVVAMPPAMKVAARLLGLVRSGGIMRNLPAVLAWHRPDSLAAANHLWQTARWSYRRHGTALVTTTDVRDPITAMTSAPGWLPSTSITLAIRTDRELDGAGLLAVPH